MTDFNIRDIETRGFVVVKNFLSDTEIQQRLADYQVISKDPRNNINLKNSVLLKSGVHGLEPKIIRLIKLLNQTTNVKTDLIGPNGIYFDTQLAELGWHQDHEAYYTWQTGYHQINFWMPLIKPDSNLSGLRVVPMDILRSKIGNLFDQRILDQGAKRFIPSGNSTHVFDDETGDEFDIPVNIDTIAVAPTIAPGDVLLIRGDVIHATQDNINHRVTLAVRSVDGSRYVDKQRFLNQPNMKKKVLDANFHGTKKIIDQFASGKDQLLIHDLFKGRIQHDELCVQSLLPNPGDKQ